jgi:hypothetical protein
VLESHCKLPERNLKNSQSAFPILRSTQSFLARHAVNYGDLTMYRPNFCSECGSKTVRLHWHLWTSRRFCDKCARLLRKERLSYCLVIAIALLSVGFIAGRASRASRPPLIIERAAGLPVLNSAAASLTAKSDASAVANSPPARAAEVYICGARTKRGKPCSRRVHSPVRCWQHKGSKAMLSEERLLVKDEQ